MDFNLESKYWYSTKVKFLEPIKTHSTLGVGGKARYFCEVSSVKDLKDIIDFANRNKLKYKVIGNCSNILVSDSGYDGIIIKLKLNVLKKEGNLVHATSDIKLSKLIDFSVNNNLCGLEELCGIPATLGGAIVMNASAFNNEISRYIKCVKVLHKGDIKLLNKEECNFSYRNSLFSKDNYTIVSADFLLPKGDRKEVIKECKLKRQNSQPIGKNCGSIFKNPQGNYAGKIIEECNLKGKAIGNVTISNKHANFLSINGDCSAKDIYLLIEYVKKEVYKQRGILLQQEVEYLGEF